MGTPPSSTRRLSVAVVDDHPAVRDAIAQAVAAQPDMDLAGVAGSAAEAFDLLRTADPDVAVVDISLGDAHGLDLVQNLRAQHPDLEVVVFSMYDEAVYAERALRAGARGYVRKSEPTTAVTEAIRAAAAGEIYLARRAASRILARVAFGAERGAPTKGEGGGRAGGPGAGPAERARGADRPGDGRVPAPGAGAAAGGDRRPAEPLAEDGRDVPAAGQGEARARLGHGAAPVRHPVDLRSGDRQLAGVPLIRPVRVVLALLLAAAAAGAQTTPAPSAPVRAEPLARALADEGFEAVGVRVAGDEVTVTYENRLLRYDVRAMERVARAATATLGDVGHLRLVPTRNGVPLVEVSMPGRREDGLDSATLSASLDVGSSPPPTTPSSRFRLDLVLHPVLGLGFGDFDDPVRLDLGVAPALDVHLWDGMSVTAQVVIPFVEETDALYSGVRPGIVAAHQELRLPLATFARVSAGLFTRQRYGLDVTTTTYVLDGRAALTLRAGQTGFAAVEGGTGRYSSPSTTTYSARLDGIVVPQYGLGAGVTVGRYLSEEPGVRADLYRSFGEATVGVFALTSEGNPNVGGQLILPLPVRRHARPGRVRVRLADSFGVEYRYRRVPGEAPDYDAAVYPWAPLGPLNPALLPYHVRRLRAP